MKRFFALILVFAISLSLWGCAASENAETPAEQIHGPSLPEEPTAEDLALVEEVLTKAMARKEAILNSPTEIVKAEEYIPGKTYTGTAYYISNNGSDRNNGLSPEKPFATLEPLWKIKPQPGDAVFFERGSTWRCMQIPWSFQSTDGITYSAYGEGEKPQLYDSPESGVGEEKWTLVHEDGEKKIWQFYKPMSEVASIAVNNNETVVREVAYWDGSNYYRIDHTANDGVQCQATEERYDWRQHLENMHCFPELFYENAVVFAAPQGDQQQLTGPNGMRIYLNGEHDKDGREAYHTGNLYFRCDEGNPGVVFEEVEFIYGFMYLDGMSDNTVLDNLAIKYCGGNTCIGGGLNGNPPASGCIVQNCEFGWMGGAVTGYSVGAVGKELHTANMGCYFQQGGAFAITGSSCSSRNNYFHHTFQEATTIELFSDRPSIDGSSIQGNLMEACGAAIMFLNWDEEVNLNHMITNCVIEENIVLFTGEDTWFNNVNMLRTETAFGTKPGPCPHDGTLHVRNNVFAFTEYAGALIWICRYDPEYAKIYENNTYIQYYGMGTINAASNLDIYLETNRLDHDYIAQWLGDTSPTTAFAHKEDVDALRKSLGY